MQAQQLSPHLGIETFKFARVSSTGSFRSSRTIVWCTLQNQALLLATLLTTAGSSLEQSRTGSGLEDLTDTLVGAGRALKVLVGTDLLADLLTLFGNVLAICLIVTDAEKGYVMRHTCSGLTGFWEVL